MIILLFSINTDLMKSLERKISEKRTLMFCYEILLLTLFAVKYFFTKLTILVISGENPGQKKSGSSRAGGPRFAVFPLDNRSFTPRRAHFQDPHDDTEVGEYTAGG